MEDKIFYLNQNPSAVKAYTLTEEESIEFIKPNPWRIYYFKQWTLKRKLTSLNRDWKIIDIFKH